MPMDIRSMISERSLMAEVIFPASSSISTTERRRIPLVRKGKCFFVPIKEIKDNGFDLSISRYKEIEYEEVHYEKPEVIIQKIETLENEIQKSLKDLKALLT
jgi:type I restriction-modification system DNA methylase subunit